MKRFIFPYYIHYIRTVNSSERDGTTIKWRYDYHISGWFFVRGFAFNVRGPTRFTKSPKAKDISIPKNVSFIGYLIDYMIRDVFGFE